MFFSINSNGWVAFRLISFRLIFSFDRRTNNNDLLCQVFSLPIWQALFCHSSFFLYHFLGRPLSCKLKVDPLSRRCRLLDVEGAVGPSLATAENFVFRVICSCHHYHTCTFPHSHAWLW